MERQTIEKFEARLRRDYPKMFSHPEAREGEILIALVQTDTAGPQAVSYTGAGLTSVRVGDIAEDAEGSPFLYYPIFANFRQYAELSLAYEKNKQTVTPP